MSEIKKAIQAICDEKGLEYDEVLDAIQSALGAAYRKDFGNRQQNLQVIFNPDNMDMKIWDEKEVVADVDEEKLEADQEELLRRREESVKEGRELTEEETEDLVRFNPKNQMMLTEAKEIDKKAKIGQILKIDQEIPGDFGRMAAQTAKQVIIQRLREAERNSVYDELKDKEGTLIHGVVQRRDSRNGTVIVDLGKVTALLPNNEQNRGEQYRAGNRMRFYILSVDMGNRGLEIVLSRSSEKMVTAIFEEEIPEIASGEVEIKGIARDPGFRSKVAVYTEDNNIDPIGSCIGQRGGRINSIIDELGGEKIDIIEYSDNIIDYIKNSLAPAKIGEVELKEDDKTATIKVVEDQFSLAIGRGGQNVRLASRLTGWKIDVVEDGSEEKKVSSEDDAEEIKEKIEEADTEAKDNVDDTTEEKDVEVEKEDEKADEKK